MKYKVLLEQVASYVKLLFGEQGGHNLPYHNIAHTQFVVDSAIQIANHYQLSDEDFFAVVTAAWFHDTGYLKKRENHEAESVKIADEYLEKEKVEKENIEKINQCIMATVMPQNPQTLLQQIICDADLFHLGSDSFTDKNKLLKKEIEEVANKEISKEDWRLESVEFLQKHHYFTDYCNVLLNDKKQQNIEKLKEKLDKRDMSQLAADLPLLNNQGGTGTPKKKNIPERGIETMFRITSGNNQRPSDMADGKAHILITVNSIIPSAIISLVLRKLDSTSFIIIPTFMLLTVSVLSIIFSIISTRPNIPPGVFSVEQIDDKKVNLLFFGNFYRMNLADYTTGMQKIMGDKDLLYHTLIMDVYSQGVVLGRKYRQLRIAYNIFMFGLVISVIAFCVAVIIHPEPVPAIPK